MAQERSNRTVLCPFCGQDIPRGSYVCPYCGSDEKTGWSKDRYMEGIGGEDEFDYDAALEREFGTRNRKGFKVSWISMIGAVLLILALLAIIKGIL